MGSLTLLPVSVVTLPAAALIVVAAVVVSLTVTLTVMALSAADITATIGAPLALLATALPPTLLLLLCQPMLILLPAVVGFHRWPASQ